MNRLLLFAVVLPKLASAVPARVVYAEPDCPSCNLVKPIVYDPAPRALPEYLAALAKRAPEPQGKIMPHTKANRVTGERTLGRKASDRTDRPTTKTDPSRITQKYHATPIPSDDTTATIHTQHLTRTTAESSPTETPTQNPPDETTPPPTPPTAHTTITHFITKTYIKGHVATKHTSFKYTRPPGYIPTFRTKTQTVIEYGDIYRARRF